MKNKSLIIMALAFFLIYILLGKIIIASQFPPVLTYNFNVSSEESSIAHNFGSTIPLGGWRWNTALIRISTTEYSSCRYDSVSGKSYDSMEGIFENYGFLHEKSFFGIDQGIFSIYVKCTYNSGNSFSPELNLNFYTNPLVSAQIFFSEEPPLRDGSYEIELFTSRPLLNAPEIKYSFDGVEHIPLPFYGSGQNWFGYLVIPPNVGEAIGSFTFKGIDLEGRVGTRISHGAVFLIDTLKPTTIQSIKAEGRKEEAFLEWYFEEQVKGFNIYRSESSSPDKSDFYQFTEKDSFVDKFVTAGKTYYYRVSAVDKAGNIGDLSRTLEITVLRANTNISAGGLSPSLVPRVENLLVELDSVYSQVENLRSSFNQMQEEKKDIAEKLNLFNEFDRSFSTLNSLKKEVELYKSQNLNENELENKISSSRVKLANLRRMVPESIYIKEEKKITESFSEANVERIYLEVVSHLLDDFNRKMVRKTNSIINERELGAETRGIKTNIQYMDGSQKDMFLLIRNIQGDLSNEENLVFVEIIPREITSSLSELSIRNRNYQPVKDLAISFPSDTKEIIYFLEGDVDLRHIEKILFSILYVGEGSSSLGGITGFFILEDLGEFSSGIIIFVIILLITILYFVFIKFKNRSAKILEEIIQKTNEARSLSSKGSNKEAKKIYFEISEKYKTLPYSLKKKIYPNLKNLREFLRESN